MSVRPVWRRVNREAVGAPFVLVGSIDRIGASTIPVLVPTERTAIVKVEEVLRAPETLGELTGASVTLLLGSGAEQGSRLLVFAQGAMYGETIAIREVARTDPEAADDVREQLRRDDEEVPVRHLRDRAGRAQIIVLGVVQELRPVRKPDNWVPPSEHDPDWWVFVIAVRGVAKGRPRAKRLEAVFANSQDVQWFTAPKPSPGLEAVFLLHRERRFDAPRGALAVIDPGDVQPPESFDDILLMVEQVG